MWPFAKVQKREKPKIDRFSNFPNTPKQPESKLGEIVEELRGSQPRAGARSGEAMDSSFTQLSMHGISEMDGYGYDNELMNWYINQSFIGYPMAAMLAQHWLIDKACLVPARDAIRNGYTVSIEGLLEDEDDTNDEDTSEIIKRVQELDKKYKVNQAMQEFIHKGRIFGIRIAIFEVESSDEKYYENPFNPDGVTQGSYKGIRQVDPIWCTPVLESTDIKDPLSETFYEPSFWLIGGQKYHHSHLIIFRNSDVPDILKPRYCYGGVPLPQRIMERVYAAERTANEAPLLAMSKRMLVWQTNTEGLAQNPKRFEETFNKMRSYRDNFAVFVADKEGDAVTQTDTSLADFDPLMSSQYQIVSAAANVPVTKLLGTTPKGFSATGEYDESNYHEELESLQTNDLTPLLDRHHLLVFHSEIKDEFNLDPDVVKITSDWQPLDSPTAKEYADISEVNSRTDMNLINTGIISADEARDRLRQDKNGSYTGLEVIEDDEDDEIPDEDPIDETQPSPFNQNNGYNGSF